MKSFEECYRKIREERLEGSMGIGTVYEHIRTKAKVFTIKNNDINKVFYIGFRTTPKDSTGVAHIMEHSVLCGSERFPLKDPFVELVKGSMNTFLNAMTYPDKTVYPVASCNAQDFENLMDVYMDAVLHPNIYKERKIFEQEGWHYELTEDGELIYNGVVYNEMKGALSSPDSVLERRTLNELFPSTTYSFESGGDPEDIPKLSYEDFLDFHRSYYHPSNSYIYLYGDMDMEERLMWLEEKYLCGYEKREVDSKVGMEAPFDKPHERSWYYPIGDSESEEKHAYLSKDFVVGGALDAKLNTAFQVLSFLLLDAPGAPLSEELIKAGIGEDILGGYQNGILQPYFSVVAKNADKEDRERFEETIDSVLRRLASEGINKKSLYAAINYFEFKVREADFGRTPAGLVYGLNALDSWLYDGDPMLHLSQLSIFAELKREAEGRYFEELIEKYLIDNSFSAYVEILPKKGLLTENEQRLKAELSAYKTGLSSEELLAIEKEAKELKLYQGEGNAPEELEKIPLLRISDIPRTTPSAGRLYAEKQGSLLCSELESNGIVYVKALFDIKDLSEEEIQFASFLSCLLGELDTRRHSYAELSDEILLNSGGLGFDTVSYPLTDGSGDTKGYIYLDFRVLEDKLSFGFDTGLEIITETLFDDEKRIGEKLSETKSRMQAKIDGASHTAAVTRAASYFDKTARFDDLSEGIAFYDFLNSASKLYNEPVHKKRFIKKLRAVAGKVFDPKRALIYAAGSKEGIELSKKKAEGFLASLSAWESGLSSPASEEIRSSDGRGLSPLGRLNEGIKTTSMVNYVARAGAIREKELPFTGALSVLRVLLNYEYLWQNLRVKGGAYGCMSGFTRSGKAYLVSYRDPEIAKTDDIYNGLPEYLESLELSERDVTKYKIGAMSDVDRPLTPSMRARDSLSAYLSGVTNEQRDKERAEILDCSLEGLRALSAYVRKLLSDDFICAIGNSSMIERDKDRFKSVRELYL